MTEQRHPTKETCPVAYRRRTCEPFCLGIEGALCTLAADHEGKHVAKIVKEFGDPPERDTHEDFCFIVSAAEEP